MIELVVQPRPDVPLAPFTTLGIGGRARWFVRATTLDEVAAAHRWCAEEGVPLFVLGGGSNLVVADRGVQALVLQMAVGGMEFDTSGSETVISVGAGEPWDRVVAEAVSRGLAGLECLSGIPGSAGGTPVQNVGAYGQEVADTISTVTVFDRGMGLAATLAGRACGFGYRTSRFKREDAGRFVVCQITFTVRPGRPTVTYPDVVDCLASDAVASPTVADVRRAVLSIRRRKGMVIDEADPDTRGVGSFFTNPVVAPDAYATLQSAYGSAIPGVLLGDGSVKVPAAWLIERSGFSRGYDHGRVGLSSKHPLAIVNRGGATARDVLELAARIKRRVAERFGICLIPEPSFVGLDDDPDVAYLRRETA